jgi:hypothetical protein
VRPRLVVIVLTEELNLAVGASVRCSAFRPSCLTARASLGVPLSRPAIPSAPRGPQFPCLAADLGELCRCGGPNSPRSTFLGVPGVGLTRPLDQRTFRRPEVLPRPRRKLDVAGVVPLCGNWRLPLRADHEAPPVAPSRRFDAVKLSLPARMFQCQDHVWAEPMMDRGVAVGAVGRTRAAGRHGSLPGAVAGRQGAPPNVGGRSAEDHRPAAGKRVGPRAYRSVGRPATARRQATDQDSGQVLR